MSDKSIVTYGSLQEMFDKAVKGLASQGFQKSSNGETCLYRAPATYGALPADTDMRCAVGHLMSEEQLEIVERSTDRRSGVMGLRHVGFECDDPALWGSSLYFFLSRLQKAHDNSRDRISMAVALSEVAAEFKLDVTVLNEKAPYAPGPYAQDRRPYNK